MSTRSTSSKAKAASKPKTTKPKAPAKTQAKSAANPEAKPKSRLAGPKPPRARVPKAPAKTVSKPVTVTELAAKSAAQRRPGKIPAPDEVPPAAQTAPASTDLKKRELLEQVVARSDVKKKYAKPVLEAMLEVLGEAVAQGRELNLPPMGKLKYNRTKETASARIVVAKLRQNKAAKAAPAADKDTLADAAE